MKKISWWAKNNPWKARMSIVVIHLLITGAGLLTGRNLLELGIQLGGLLCCTALLFFLGGAFFYPDKKLKDTYPVTFNFYNRQKTCDLMMAFSTFIMVGFISNKPEGPFIFSGVLRGAAVTNNTGMPGPAVATPGTTKKPLINIHTTRAERKAFIKGLKKVLRESFRGSKVKDVNKETRLALVIMSIIVGVGLSILLAALACNIACTSSEGLALLVLLAGAAAIAGLLIVAIRSIHKHFPQKFETVPGKGVPVKNE